MNTISKTSKCLKRTAREQSGFESNTIEITEINILKQKPRMPLNEHLLVNLTLEVNSTKYASLRIFGSSFYTTNNADPFIKLRKLLTKLHPPIMHLHKNQSHSIFTFSFMPIRDVQDRTMTILLVREAKRTKLCYLRHSRPANSSHAERSL